MIRIENIHLQIGNQLLLDDEEFIANEGYIHVIMGESGSGKTTFLYEISLLSHISESLYDWNGLRVDKLSDHQRAQLRRNHIGYILQDLELISEDLSLKDNIDCMFALTGQDYDENKVNEYMNKMNLHCSLDQRVEEMSRGERQRFALVLALIKDVDLIICDEPTSALDIENTKELMNYLKLIARDYHKIIIIATHDNYVGEEADILYKIENQHLMKVERVEYRENKSLLKRECDIDNRFFKIYRKGHKKVSQSVIKAIYVMMIMILCIAPMVLDSMLNRQQELYHMYASNEIIVVNTKEVLPSITYNKYSQLFNDDQFDMLKEIKHVKNVNYYWEMEGFILEGDKSIEVTVIPKKDIQEIIFSSSLASKIKKGTLNASLVINEKEYDFEVKIDKHSIKNYPPKANIKTEIIYMPHNQMKSLLKEKNITKSSSISIECDDIKNIESTSQEIQRWLTHATISSEGTKYLEQIQSLQVLQQFMVVLRVVMVIGIIAIAYIIQTMENKSREKEINNLRINGTNKKAFYLLYYYENISIIILTLLCCLLGYIASVILFDMNLSIMNIGIILVESMIYIIITRIIPLFISVQQIFSKDISKILRESM